MASWLEFRKKYGADRRVLLSRDMSPDEIRAWQYWLKHVFMPINRRMFDIILAKTDLIEGDEMPQSFVDFCAHVSGYEVTLAQWADDDYSNLGSVINHPGSALEVHVEATYKELKLRQRALLGNAPQTGYRRPALKRPSSGRGEFGSSLAVPSSDPQQAKIIWQKSITL
jgi:hypothetical protein